jgi:hypothetical protein
MKITSHIWRVRLQWYFLQRLAIPVQLVIAMMLGLKDKYSWINAPRKKRDRPECNNYCELRKSDRGAAHYRTNYIAIDGMLVALPQRFDSKCSPSYLRGFDVNSGINDCPCHIVRPARNANSGQWQKTDARDYKRISVWVQFIKNA